ncbi:MAG: GHKL domain-containing protein [Clostridia bacterium]|nr:GHKL domain-containing protein [Clostridia bacterium]
MVNILFELLVNVIEEGTALLFMSFYLGWKFKGAKRIAGFTLATIAAVILISYFNSLFLNEGLYTLLLMLMYFIYALVCLKGDIYSKLFISAFTNSLMSFIAIISIMLFSMFFETAQLYVISGPRYGVIFVSKALLILVCTLLIKFKNSSLDPKMRVNVATVVPFAGILSASGITSIFLKTDLAQEMLFISFAVLFVNLLIYYIFMKISRDMEEESEAKILLQKYEMDKKHTTEVEELYSKTCSIRHDMVNHLETVASLIEKDSKKALEYIESVTKNQISGIRSFVKTGNDTFDAVINSKVALCDKKDIKVQIRVMNHSLDRLKSHEIGIIFGNLFDNAIEASEALAEKRIELDVQSQGARTSIVMKNTIAMPVLEKNHDLNTTKEDNSIHGFGIRNIRTIVEEYGGMINFFEEDNFFGCDILI